MAREIPEIVRAAAGLAATVLDEARKLPETLPGLPVRAIGLAMQQAMRIQQQYVGLVARGDELLTGLRGEHEPGLATFDDDLDGVGTDDVLAPPSAGYRESAFDRADVELAEPAPTEPAPTEPAPTEVALTEVALTEITLTEEPAGDDAAAPPAGGKRGRPKKDEGRGGKTRTNAAAAADAAQDAAQAAALPADPEADAVVSAVEEVAAEVEGAQAALDALPGQAPSTEEVLEELAIDEMVGDAPTGVTTEGTEPDLTADVATTADVLTPDGDIATVEAVVTDEGVAAPEAPTGTDDDSDAGTATDEPGAPVAAATGVRTDVGGPDTAEDDAAIEAGAAVDAVGADTVAPTDDPEGGSDLSGSQAVGSAPVDGYDGFSIAQLRGHLRGYQLSTVTELLSYEEATRAREPYLRMLRNRLEKLEQQAVESSPLAPRGT